MSSVIDLSKEGIEHCLLTNATGHLGCTDNTIPYVFPMAYGYYDGVIYGQTTKGKKIDIIRQHSYVCFQVESVTPSYWESVQCWGNFEELDFAHIETKQQEYLVRVLTERLSSIQHNFGVHIEYDHLGHIKPLHLYGKESVLFRIPIEHMSGIRHPIS